MEKTVRRFDMSRYATPKSEEDKRTLSEHDYVKLPVDKALLFVESMKQLTREIEILPQYITEGSIELRYYKEGAKDIGKEKGNRIFAYFKEAERVIPVTLADEGEEKAAPITSGFEEGK